MATQWQCPRLETREIRIRIASSGGVTIRLPATKAGSVRNRRAGRGEGSVLQRQQTRNRPFKQLEDRILFVEARSSGLVILVTQARVGTILGPGSRCFG